MESRYLESYLLEDLSRKMVFVSGPRQAGKTTLSRFIGKEHFLNPDYMNWDYAPDRERIVRIEFKSDSDILLFDEIHKYGEWKNYLKGLYDTRKEDFKIMVTGSARLSMYRRGGDSMLGRYHNYRLHPFSMAEMIGFVADAHPFHEIVIQGNDHQNFYNSLLKLGGFPEPLLSGSERTLRRWNMQRKERLIKEDIRDLEAVRDMSKLVLLADMLPGKIGSLLSTNSIREDLSVAFKTAAHWLNILESFYYHFRIYPYTVTNVRSLKKEPKLYLWDWTEIREKGPKLENLVACHLLKFCHFLEDSQGYRMSLHFLRDLDGREVDFLVCCEGKPWFAVEVKSGKKKSRLRYFLDRIEIPFAYVLTEKPGTDLARNGIRTVSIDRFLAALV